MMESSVLLVSLLPVYALFWLCILTGGKKLGGLYCEQKCMTTFYALAKTNKRTVCTHTWICVIISTSSSAEKATRFHTIHESIPFWQIAQEQAKKQIDKKGEYISIIVSNHLFLAIPFSPPTYCRTVSLTTRSIAGIYKLCRLGYGSFTYMFMCQCCVVKR